MDTISHNFANVGKQPEYKDNNQTSFRWKFSAVREIVSNLFYLLIWFTKYQEFSYEGSKNTEIEQELQKCLSENVTVWKTPIHKVNEEFVYFKFPHVEFNLKLCDFTETATNIHRQYIQRILWCVQILSAIRIFCSKIIFKPTIDPIIN